MKYFFNNKSQTFAGFVSFWDLMLVLVIVAGLFYEDTIGFLKRCDMHFYYFVAVH